MYIISDNVAIREQLRQNILVSGDIKIRLLKAGYLTLESIQNFISSTNKLNSTYQLNNDVYILFNSSMGIQPLSLMTEYFYYIHEDIVKNGLITESEYEFINTHLPLFCNIERFGNNDIILKV